MHAKRRDALFDATVRHAVQHRQMLRKRVSEDFSCQRCDMKTASKKLWYK